MRAAVMGIGPLQWKRRGSLSARCVTDFASVDAQPHQSRGELIGWVTQPTVNNIRPQSPLHSLVPAHCKSFSSTSNPIAVGSSPNTAAAMATLSSDGLQTLLGAVGVEGIIPSFPLADIQNSPMGIYLSYLAEILVQLTECEPQIAYESIQWPNEVGDLVVVLPRLRLKDANSQDLATELMERVGGHALFSSTMSLSI